MNQRLAKWRTSFRYAYEGLKYAFNSQRNMKFHFLVAFFVLMTALLLGLSRTDILFILIAVTMMFVTELINTAIEKTVDLVTSERHPLAKVAKDTAAAAVLVAAVFACFVGFVVFYEPLEQLFRVGHVVLNNPNPATIWVIVTLIVLVVVVIQARFAHQRKFVKPSLLAAVAYSIATLIALIAELTYIALLAYSLASLIFVLLYDKQSRSSVSLVFGALLGILVTLLIFILMQMV